MFNESGRSPGGGTLGVIMMKIPKIYILLSLIVLTKLLSGCFIFTTHTSTDKANKKQIKKLPDSEIVFYAKYAGTQTGTQIYFRRDSIFVLTTQGAFGWSQYNGNFKRLEESDTFSLIYLNDYNAKWNYVVIQKDKALLKKELNDTISKQIKTFQITKNIISN